MITLVTYIIWPTCTFQRLKVQGNIDYIKREYCTALNCIIGIATFMHAYIVETLRAFHILWVLSFACPERRRDTVNPIKNAWNCHEEHQIIHVARLTFKSFWTKESTKLFLQCCKIQQCSLKSMKNPIYCYKHTTITFISSHSIWKRCLKSWAVQTPQLFAIEDMMA